MTAVLHAEVTGTGLGDNAFFTHALGEQDLAHGVVDFMRAGVEKVLALEIKFRAT